MTKASDNVFPKVIFAEGAAPSTPSSGQVKIYAKSDGLMYSKDDLGAETAMSSGSAATPVMTNEVMNFPSIEGADNAQPEWWEEEDANATLTEVDVTGESITETWDRCLKVVTTADKYAYQQFTYADHQRVKSGRTVSLSVAVWSVSSVTARIRLQSSVGSLGSATTTAAAWTVLKVEGVVLDGTNVQIRLEVNNGTAYFVPLAFGVGTTAPSELAPRGLKMRWADAAVAKSWTGLGDEATWTDVDVTSITSNLAVAVQAFAYMEEGTERFIIYYRRNGSSEAIGFERHTVDGNTQRSHAEHLIYLDDSQIFEYYLDRTSGTGTFAAGTLAVSAWWEWA